MYVKKGIAISKPEWHIMQAIWNKSPLMMCDIISEFKDLPWKNATIQTMVSRLVSKNIVGVDRSNRAFKYYPLVSEQEASELALKYLIDTIYRGDAVKCIIDQLEDDSLTEVEKENIKKMFE
ncbi:MAG: BlaI/MecI/CopY family transcriptional regulator [Saccharofermentanales bacterium]